jgi:hypothetical protein
MKKIIIFISALVFMVFAAIFAIYLSDKNTTCDYIFVEVLAHSEKSCDENAAYEISQTAIDYITPYLNKSKDGIYGILPQVEDFCNDKLLALKLTYYSSATAKSKAVPSLLYGDTTIKGGTYDVLTITLGDGQGACTYGVIYIGADKLQSVKYRSYIFELFSSN